MRIGLFLLSQLGATNQRNAFSYLQNIVSNHQLEFGGEWQLRFVINAIGKRRMNSAAKKEKRKMEKAKLEELSAAQELERARRETKNKDSRVVGGFEVTDNSWQFMVDIGGLCGGSLISNQFVLTAAHCCTSSSFNFSVIRLGIKDLTDNANSINRSAKSYVVHPDFDPTKFKHDICLVLLDSPVQINDRVQPISLPMESEELFSQNSDSYLYVAGWGMTGERNTKPISELISHKLLNAMIPFVPDATCQQDDYYGTLVDTEYTFCAGDDVSDTCSYDSGGPAVVLKKRNDRYDNYVSILAGITSWGEGCAREKRPGVYTRVQKYLSWIKQEQINMDENQTSCGTPTKLINVSQNNVDIDYTCSKLDQRCWFNCPIGYIPSVISIKCRNERTWVSAQAQVPIPRSSIKCEKSLPPKTSCGNLKVPGYKGNQFSFDTTKVEARCNNAQECLFYCKNTNQRAYGMFYTRCKTLPQKYRWKPRPRITQEPRC